MKAIFFEQHGEIDVLKYGELPDPTPAAGEALIRVRAVALNHLDIWVRRGWNGLRLGMPHIGGSDIAGELVAVEGIPASQWRAGSRVIVNPGVISGEDEWTRRGEESVSPGYKIVGEQLRGGLAEYLVVPFRNVFNLPDSVSFEEGAAPLLVGTTCWRMLVKRAALRAGESVLVVGAGGGVNSLAIRLAHAMGATVYAVAGTPHKARRALELGARQAICYADTPRWEREILALTKGRGVDVVVDNVGAATIEASLRAAARGGRIVTVGNTSGPQFSFDNRLVFTKQLSLIGSTMGSTQDFIDMLNFIWTNQISSIIDRVEPLSAGIAMIQQLEHGTQFGKIVLRP